MADKPKFTKEQFGRDARLERQAGEMTEKLVKSGQERKVAESAVRDAVERNRAGKP